MGLYINFFICRFGDELSGLWIGVLLVYSFGVGDCGWGLEMLLGCFVRVWGYFEVVWVGAGCCEDV